MVVEGDRWSPWNELTRRGHLLLWWGHLDGCSGMLEDIGGGMRRVWLDERLDQVGRRCTLAHELIHDERNLLYRPDTPKALVAKEEAAVNREVARRLVPIEELASFIATRADIEPITASVVADEWRVTEVVAQRALARMRHPSMGFSRRCPGAP